jgi:hypothetical protein
VPFGTPLPDDQATLEALTPADLRRVAQRRLRAEAMTLVVARPPLTYAGAAVISGVAILLIVAAIVVRVRRRRRAA